MPSTSHRFVYALFALTCLGSLAFAAPLVGDHVAAQQVADADVTASGVRVDDGEVRVSLTVANPTPRPVTVPTTGSYNSLGVYVAGERVNLIRRSTLEGATIPPGETATVTATLTLREAYRDDPAAVRGATLSGILPVRIDGHDVGVGVEATVDRNGGVDR